MTSYNRFSDGMDKTAEESAQGEMLLPRLDLGILSRMLRTLDKDDDEWERFFVGLACACSSRVMDPQGIVVGPEGEGLKNALIGWAERTFTSNLVPEEIKDRRISIYIKTAMYTTVLKPSDLIKGVLLGSLDGLLSFVAFGLEAQIWLHHHDPLTIFLAECAIAATIACVERRNQAWSDLVLVSLLGVEDPSLQKYIQFDDSPLLANLIFIVGQMRSNHPLLHEGLDFYTEGVIPRTLQLVCNFNPRRTSLELQHRFCDLWNELVGTAQNGENSPRTRQFSIAILKDTRKIICELCKGEDAPLTGEMRSFNIEDDDHPVLRTAASYGECQVATTRFTASPTPYGPPEGQHNMQSPTPSLTSLPSASTTSTIVAPTSVQDKGSSSGNVTLKE